MRRKSCGTRPGQPAASAGVFHRFQEKKLVKPGDDAALEAPRWINYPQTTFFVIKLVLVSVGYGLLLTAFIYIFLHPVEMLS